MATIIYQDYGTSILLFIKGATEQDAYDKWLSIFNWGATSTNPDFVTDKTIACWSNTKKFIRYLFNIHETRILQNPGKMTKQQIAALATQRAQAEFESIPRESFRSVNSAVLPFELGEINAEKPDDDFASAMFNHFSHRD